MKNRIIFLLSGMFLLLSHTQAEACDLDPTAVIDILPDEVVFLVGDSIYMEAYNSSPNCVGMFPATAGVWMELPNQRAAILFQT